MTLPGALLDFIRGGEKFLVAGHKEPDGDCIGSQLALCSGLRRLGKTALPCQAGPFKRPEVKLYADLFLTGPTEVDKAGARLIIVDCSSISRTGDIEPLIKGLPTAMIDHHASGQTAEGVSGPASFIDPKAPSTTFLVQKIIEELLGELTLEEAELLLFGLCTDTGFFRHGDDGSEETFLAAARLIRAGASPNKTFRAINGGRSLNSRILLGMLLSRAQPYFAGRLILSVENLEDTERFGLEGRDSDNLYQLLQSVEGVEAVAIIRQEKPDNCTIGFRSRDQLDVAAVAAHFGGGGHRNASGCSTKGTIAAIKPQILDVFRTVFHDICHSDESKPAV
ncbi:phosphoesterase [Spirochaetia bacterium]|nr:phosphoesterase [Spirochaetia bacterium]